MLILILVFLCWPWIVKWFRGFMARRMEDAARRMMGMPSRKEEQRRNRAKSKKQNSQSGSYRRHRAPQQRPSDILEAVAVDVDYTEIKEFESTADAEIGARGRQQRIYREEQVSDAEFTEIKGK